MTDFPHLRRAMMASPWAMMPERMAALAEVVERRAAGVRLSVDEIALIKGEREPNGVLSYLSLTASGALQSGPPSPSGHAAGSVVAVINVMGILAQHASQVDDISGPGGTSTERVGQSLSKAVNDPAIGSIVMNFDTPGGNVHGVQALAAQMRKARDRKPVIAQINSLAASAGYWLASNASEIVMTPGALVGSIGVYGLHTDVSGAAKQAGLKFTFVSAGKYKTEGNPYEPLGTDAFAAQKKQVDAFYADFVNDVARGRGIGADKVRSGFGEGRTVKDSEAVKMGMADRVATLDDTLSRQLASKRSTPAPARANALASTHADQDFRRRRHAARMRV